LDSRKTGALEEAEEKKWEEEEVSGGKLGIVQVRLR